MREKSYKTRILEGALKRSGLTREDIAKRSGVSTSSVSRYIRHPATMPLFFFNCIVRATNMPEEDERVFTRQAL